ncbi:MAG: PleD family two-component system response regulator [Bdellovibrionales bacterium]
MPLDIICVDDNKTQLKIFEAHLKDQDYMVEYFENPEDALERLKTEVPKLLVLDLLMPGITGEELLMKFSEYKNWSGMKILVVTGSDVDKTKVFTLATLGVHEVLTKPIHPDAFRAKIESMIDAA